MRPSFEYKCEERSIDETLVIVHGASLPPCGVTMSLPDKLIALVQKIATDSPEFFEIKGPGEGDKANDSVPT